MAGNSGSTTNVHKLLGEVKTDITKAVGGTVSEEINRLIEVFAANSESIENNFSTLRQRIDDLE